MEFTEEQQQPIGIEKIVAHLAEIAAAIRSGELPQEAIDEISDAAMGIIEAVNESHGVPPTLEIFSPEEELKRKIIAFFELGETYSVERIKLYIFGTKNVEPSVHEALMTTLHDMRDQKRIEQYSGLYMSVATRSVISQIVRQTRQKQADKLARAPNPPRERNPDRDLQNRIRAAHLGGVAAQKASSPNKPRNGNKR